MNALTSQATSASRVSDEAIRQQLTYWRDRANHRPDEFAEQLVACLEELQARNADAARYRWLCKPCSSNRLPHVTQYPPAQFDGDKYFAVQMDKHGMDAAIDAAMRLAP
jgi:hypothetical protein